MLIAVLMLVMVSSQRIMLIVTQWLVYPLIAILLFVTLYLIPSWKLDGLTAAPSAGDLLMSIWLVIPVLVFAFNHSPAISQFSLALQRRYGQAAATRASAVLARTGPADGPLP